MSNEMEKGRDTADGSDPASSSQNPTPPSPVHPDPPSTSTPNRTDGAKRALQLKDVIKLTWCEFKW